MNAKEHQICSAHLLRDLNYINALYEDKCGWEKDMKALVQQAIQLKKEFIKAVYYYPNIKRQALFDKLHQLLHYPIKEAHTKSITLQKNCWQSSSVFYTF